MKVKELIIDSETVELGYASMNCDKKDTLFVYIDGCDLEQSIE